MIQLDLSAIDGSSSRWQRMLRRKSVLWALRASIVVLAIAIAGPIQIPLYRAYTILAIAACGLLAVQALYRVAHRRRETGLRAFASSNRLTYVPTGEWRTPSAIINGTRNRRVVDEFSGSGADGSFRIGTLCFETERAGVNITECWGFVSQSVPAVDLPHILLLSRSDSGRSLPVSLDATQRLLLEGDFPRYFDVYCIHGSERDALYVLTPDLMASLVDNAGYSSLELTGSTVTFFTPGRFDADDAAQWRHLVQLAESVGLETRHRVDRFGRGRERPSTAGVTQSTPGSRSVLATSTGRSNPSTWIVGALSTAVVLGAMIWAAIR